MFLQSPSEGVPANSTLSRRGVLRVTSGAFATAGFIGSAGAMAGDNRNGKNEENKRRINVGYANKRGRRQADRRAQEKHYQFAFDAMTIEASEEAHDDLQNNPNIRYAELDTKKETHGEVPWGIDRTDADVAHENGEAGNGADIAIIDTGIDSSHPDLQPNLGKGVAFLSGTKSGQWEDDNGHGTHCAGIADAVDDGAGVEGVSTAATLHAVKVMNAAGTGLSSDIARGIEWTADQGYDGGSLSLGSSSQSDAIRDACQYAYKKGVFLSAAAGNSGPCTDCASYPAANEWCMAVSATNRDDQLANYSSQGTEVEIAAPGTDIYSTYLGGTYERLSGTSMACPHVAGAGGQLMSDGYTNNETRTQLKSSTEDVGLSSNEGGAGLLDVASALGLTSTDDGLGNVSSSGGGLL